MFSRSTRGRPRKNNPTDVMVSRKYDIGQRVYGIRTPNAFAGELVRTYVTLNEGWRNPAYVVKCDVDGKERSFQMCRDETKPVTEYILRK